MIKHLTAFFASIATASCFAAPPAPQFTLVMDASGKYSELLQFLKNQSTSQNGLQVGTLLLDVQNPASDSGDFSMNSQCLAGKLSECGKAIQFLAQLQAQDPAIKVYAMIDVSNKYTTSWQTFQPAVQWVINANKALSAATMLNGKSWKPTLFFTGIVYDKQSNDIKTSLASWATQMRYYMQADKKLTTLGLIGAYGLIGDVVTNTAPSIDKYYLEMYSITKKLASPQDANKTYTYIDTVATEETYLQPGGAQKYTSCLGDRGTLPGEKTPPASTPTDKCPPLNNVTKDQYLYPNVNDSLYTQALTENAQHPEIALFPTDPAYNNGQNFKFLINGAYQGMHLTAAQYQKVVFLFSTESYGATGDPTGCVAQPGKPYKTSCGEISAFGTWYAHKQSFINFTNAFSQYYTKQLSNQQAPTPITNVGIYQFSDLPCSWVGPGVCTTSKQH